MNPQNSISQETQDFIQRNLSMDIRQVALKASGQKLVDAEYAIAQIQGYQALKKKVPSWCRDGMVFPLHHLPLEQCSSEDAALYKKKIIEQSNSCLHSFADLTGGMGIDFSFIAPLFTESTYIERQESLFKLARHNFQMLGLKHALCLNSDAQDILSKPEEHYDWIMLDPARRDTRGGKVVLLEDCEPNVLEIKEELLRKADHILLKLSPMLDLSRAMEQLGCAKQAHIISINNECKELLLVLCRQKTEDIEDIPIKCINLRGHTEEQLVFSRRMEQEARCPIADTIHSYLYEPNASIMKAGGYNWTGQQYRLEKLDDNSHIYTSNMLIENFQGKIFRVLRHSGMAKKELKELLNGIQAANIATRNFPMSTDELRKRLKIKDGGNHFLIASTLKEIGHRIILCERISQ